MSLNLKIDEVTLSSFGVETKAIVNLGVDKGLEQYAVSLKW